MFRHPLTPMALDARVDRDDVADGLLSPDGPALLDEAAQIAQVVQLVHEATQVDLGHYKASTFHRQLQRRMLELGCASLDDYVAGLRGRPAELRHLQRSLLISVTRFFRDPDVFAQAARAIDELVQAQPDGQPLRLWVPGCATGEEAYSLAMLVVDALGPRLSRVPVRLFATDIDEQAIAVARRGVYAHEAVAALDADLVARHFERDEEGVRPHRRVRELCVFARHDLLAQPPFVHVDLVSCRNVMIYFRPAVQADVLARFHHALRPNGWLLLGQSESVGVRDELFVVHHKPARLYRRRPGPTPHAPGWRASRPHPDEFLMTDAPMPSSRTWLESRFHRMLLQRDGRPSVLVGVNGEVLQAWAGVDRYLQLGSGPDLSLLGLCRAELRDEVRNLLQLARSAAPTEVVSPILSFTTGDGAVCQLRVRAQAVPDDDAGWLGVVVTFDDWTPASIGIAPDATAPSADEVTVLRHELAVAREQIQVLARQLASSQQERQSLHEELQTSSEELQASNEELQASNEELNTLNEQLMAKSDELSSLNDLLLNIEHSMQLAMVVVDRQMCVQRFNPLAVRIFGLMDGDIGRPLLSVPSSLTLDELPGQLAQVLRTGQPQLARIDQGDRHYVLQLSPLLDGQGVLNGAIVGFTDVAELRQAEAERARLAAIVTHSEDAIVGKTLDGIITSWNPGAERLFGYGAQEAIGQPMLMVFPDELKDQEPALLARVARGDTVPAFDTQRRHKDGRTLHVSVALSPIRDALGRVTGVSKIARDISDRVADEAVRTANLQRLEQLVQDRTRALAEKEHQLQSILDGVPGMVAYWDADMRLRFANRLHRAMLDPTGSGQMIGLTMREVLGETRFTHAWPCVQRVLQGEPQQFETTGPDPTMPGRLMHHQVNLVPHVIDGAVTGYIAMVFDVSGLKHAEAAAEAASRAKSEFLANMSHEIRTPLNAVLGLAQVAQRQHEGRPVAQTFGLILQAGQHLLGVINDVLDFSKIEAGKLELQIGRLDITELIDKAVGMVSGQARSKGLSLRVTRDPGMAEAYAGDAVRVAQLLINLLTNAVKFTETGRVELVLRAHEGGVAILVSDTGPGMTPDVIGRLFKPFEQGDGSITRKVGGTGLGLSITKRLVDLMQGRIQVHSEPGQGSVFDIWLPMLPMVTHVVGKATVPEAEPVPASPPTHRQRLSGVHVLVVEDHVVNQMVLQQLLQVEGASLALANHGGQAVDQLAASLQPGQRDFDVVLCDIEMPVMDGYEATRRMRAMAPDLPILGLTAHAFDDARQRGAVAGMTGYLSKPYMVEELVRTILSLLPPRS